MVWFLESIGFFKNTQSSIGGCWWMYKCGKMFIGNSSRRLDPARSLLRDHEIAWKVTLEEESGVGARVSLTLARTKETVKKTTSSSLEPKTLTGLPYNILCILYNVKVQLNCLLISRGCNYRSQKIKILQFGFSALQPSEATYLKMEVDWGHRNTGLNVEGHLGVQLSWGCRASQ